MPKTPGQSGQANSKMSPLAKSATIYENKTMENPELRKISSKNFIMLDGQGAPDGVIADATTIRRVIKAMGLEPGLLEALWWSEDGGDVKPEDPASWRWTLMICPSGAPTAADFAKGIAKAKAEKNEPALEKLRFEAYEEGQVVQVLNIGSLRDKQPRLEAMLAYALTQNLKPEGKYHEIYVDDPGDNTPLNPRTILRQPVRP